MPYVNLKAELKRIGVSYKELAKILNVSRNTVTNKLEGKTTFGTREIEKIKKDIFGNHHSYDYLFKEQ